MKQPITLETALDLLQTFADAAEGALSNTPDWRIHLNNAMQEWQTTMSNDWGGHPDPDDPDNYWIDDKTGKRIKA